MSYSSILSAMDCKYGSMMNDMPVSGKMSCHDHHEMNKNKDKAGCVHCDYFSCHTLMTIPGKELFSNIVFLENEFAEYVLNYPDIPINNIFHPPRS